MNSTSQRMAPATDFADPVRSGGRWSAYRAGRSRTAARIDRAIAEIDIRDSNSVLFFGSKAQEKLTALSDTMLEGVRNKDVGPAGDALGDMLTTLRGFSPASLIRTSARAFSAGCSAPAKPVAKFLQRYEEVRRQIDAIGDRLDAHKSQLMADIIALDKLYAANLEYFHELADYIAAGDEKLRQLDEEVIPALQRKAEARAKCSRLRNCATCAPCATIWTGGFTT